MAGRLLAKLKAKDPAALVRDCHQAFMRLPFEANPERVAEEIAKLLHTMKARAGCCCWVLLVLVCRSLPPPLLCGKRRLLHGSALRAP